MSAQPGEGAGDGGLSLGLVESEILVTHFRFLELRRGQRKNAKVEKSWVGSLGSGEKE